MVTPTTNGSRTVGGESVQRAIANGSASSGEIALFVSLGTIRSLTTGAVFNLTTDTSTNVVTVKANLSNYGSGTGVQYLLDTTNRAIDSLLLGNSATLVNDGIGSAITNHTSHLG